MSKEDEMVSHLIGFQEPGELDEADFDGTEYTAIPEAHYDHYGTRGAVDLFTRVEGDRNGRTYLRDAVYEVKSDNAVRKATGANEIIRQYNKHRKYFYKDESTKSPNSVSFELVFIPSRTTVKHVLDNADMYAAADQQSVHDEKYWTERIFFRTVGSEDDLPVKVGSKYGDFREPEQMLDGFPNYESECGQEIVKILEELLN